MIEDIISKTKTYGCIRVFKHGWWFFYGINKPKWWKRICCCVLLIDPQGVWECRTEKSKWERQQDVDIWHKISKFKVLWNLDLKIRPTWRPAGNPVVDQLVSMGFDRERSKNALEAGHCATCFFISLRKNMCILTYQCRLYIHLTQPAKYSNHIISYTHICNQIHTLVNAFCVVSYDDNHAALGPKPAHTAGENTSKPLDNKNHRPFSLEFFSALFCIDDLAIFHQICFERALPCAGLAWRIPSKVACKHHALYFAALWRLYF